MKNIKNNQIPTLPPALHISRIDTQKTFNKKIP